MGRVGGGQLFSWEAKDINKISRDLSLRPFISKGLREETSLSK